MEDDLIAVPSYMIEPEATNDPLVSEVVSPTHPVTARQEILKAAKLGQLRSKILRQDQPTAGQKLAYGIVVLSVLCAAVVVTAKVVDSEKRKTWLVLFWLILLFFLGLSYLLIFPIKWGK